MTSRVKKYVITWTDEDGVPSRYETEELAVARKMVRELKEKNLSPNYAVVSLSN
jgi:hypothetical protein